MLRTRLFLYLAPFVVVLLAVGVYAIALFSRVTENVVVTVSENYRSVLAVQDMELALTRMEEGVLLAMEDNKGLGAAIFEKNRQVFDKSLGRQLQNGKTPNETELNRQLRDDYTKFARGGAGILTMTNTEEQQTAFKKTLEPELPAVYQLLDQIHQLNHEAILATTNNVRGVTAHVTRLMLVGLAAALVIAGLAWYRLAKSILAPIQSLTRATRALGEGNLDQLVPVNTRGELGELADSFNKMADQLRIYRRSTAEKIVRLHRTMEATLASFPDPIFVLNREGIIELMNLAATELSKSLELENQLPEPVRETVREALETGKSFLPHSFKEVVSFRLGGQEKFLLPRVLAMRNEENALIGVAVVLYDVTRFRLLDDAKTNLVATVSHEIKTPLTSVRMALHLLLEKTLGALSPRQQDLLATAREDSERLLRILNDLLDLTRLEEGNSDLYKEQTSPADLVQSVADLMREAVTSKNLKLTCRTDPDLPPVLVDRQRINHVFSNLINNAIKYSPAGGEIVLHASRAGEREVQFSVRDQGPGVPEDHQDRIFDRFYRVPGQSKKGAGLGLSIAREIVLAHGGRIGVRSEHGRGSEFYFLLSGVDAEAPQESNAGMVTTTA
jgi:two-component system, NtrC family, sensor histidine kinase KinB